MGRGGMSYLDRLRRLLAFKTNASARQTMYSLGANQLGHFALVLFIALAVDQWGASPMQATYFALAPWVAKECWDIARSRRLRTALDSLTDGAFYAVGAATAYSYLTGLSVLWGALAFAAAYFVASYFWIHRRS